LPSLHPTGDVKCFEVYINHGSIRARVSSAFYGISTHKPQPCGASANVSMPV
jgi:hypothetical protein